MIHSSPCDTVAVPDVSLPRFVLDALRAQGDRPAIVDGPSGRMLTAAQVVAQTERFGASLATRGFRKGDVLAILSPNVPEYACVFLGTNLVGGIVTTLNPLYTRDEVAHQLVETGARLLFTVGPLLPQAIAAAAGTSVEEILVLGEGEGATPYAALMHETGPVPAVAIDPAEDLAALPYSSGTSGVPKGVMLTHRNLVAQLCQAEPTRPQVTDSVILAALPFFHIYGMMLILMLGLRVAAKLVTMARWDFEVFLDCVQKYRVTYAPLVPPIVLALAKHPLVDKYDLSSLQTIGSGAAPLGQEVEEACARRVGCSIYQGYGMTEFAGVSITNVDAIGFSRSGSVGVCWPLMEARLVDPETGLDTPAGGRGELWMRGPNVMRGYWRRPDATAETITPDGWLRTGDVAYVDADGYFFIVDRVKELIKHNAYQIAPAELEAVLLTHPSVADAAVIPSPDEETGEVPKAFVVLKAPVDTDAILAFVAERVAPYKKIRRIEVVEAIPKSPSGKILRRKLVEQERARQAV
jgi:acyl-CoA synthetase (AMP-forming)/AMP-acid ligase II